MVIGAEAEGRWFTDGVVWLGYEEGSIWYEFARMRRAMCCRHLGISSCEKVIGALNARWVMYVHM